ncbi:MAG: diversity-generating retroelement protein Avd [Synechococcales cyanobacterium CRU_2_2]|nr:diversity-generating retroelement protein Avd [Synechococcales cyanobacterium CRU_2_2]
MENISILQRTYDLIKWYVPLLNKLPKSHKFNLGDRLIARLYDILEQLILARYEHNKLPRLTSINGSLEIVRYQTRILLDFNLINEQRYEYVSKLINDIGIELGGWIKQQKSKPIASKPQASNTQASQRP